MKKKMLIAITVILSVLGGIYYTFFTLDVESITEQELMAYYQYHPPEDLDFKMTPISQNVFKFSFKSFDGAVVNGQVGYPMDANLEQDKAFKFPVLIGLHAMGRSYPRWWTDSLKGRPTVTRVNEITKLANQKGYAVIALDARYHGSRKDPENSLSAIMMMLTFLGDKSRYQSMIRESILDYRVLLDWVEKQANLDDSEIALVGYSMGGQMSLLLGAIDSRINKIAAIVPPFIDDRMVRVAPKNVTHLLGDKTSVWLLTSDADENSDQGQNLILFNLINNQNKKHIDYPGNHILPEGYERDLVDWL
ncbi:MAG: alpha/beta fold hydrolase [Kangiellaceae bacterium]|nr:alpha/beta fold hydrolase [Kangiellaceae bacterium]